MSQDSSQYVQRLDLEEDPFAPEYAGNYFYSGALRKQLLDQIIHLSRFGDHVVIVTGDVGSGKSTLLEATFSQLEPLMDCCHINAEFAASAEEILESLSDQLSLDLDVTHLSATNFLLALETYSPADFQAEPILVGIDQAHHLNLEGLECLLDLFNHGQGAICLLLAGEYQIEQLVQLTGFVGERTKVLDLEPLTLNEVDEYLLGLLYSVGYIGNQPLSSDQIAMLHQQSGGNLEEINQISSRMLAGDGFVAHKRLGFALPTAHLAVIAILAIVLVFSYFSQEENENTDDVVQKDRVNIPIQDLFENSSNKGDENPDSHTVVNRKKLRVSKFDSDDAKIKKQSSVQPVSQSVDSEDSKTQVKEDIAEKQQAVDVVPTEINEQVDEFNPAVQQTSTELVTKELVTTELVTTEPDPATREVVEPASISDTVEHVDQVEKIKKPDSADIPKSSKVTTTNISTKEQRLMNLPSTSYMLQLLGSLEEKRSRDFVKEYVGRLPITYAEVMRDGKPWYVVLTGPFDDRDAAIAAISHLPDALQKQKPWARSVISIQKDLLKK